MTDPASDATGAVRPRLSRNGIQLNGAGRIAGLDFARGLAIIGMLAAHLLWLGDDVVLADPSTWSNIAAGRSSILFATLAGVSLGLMTGGRHPARGAAMGVARRRIALRAALLWVLGVLLIGTGVPVYVILPAYAVLFLLALPALTLSTRVVLVLAGVLAVVMPFAQVLLDALPFWGTPIGESAALMIGWQYPFPVWIAFVLAGLGIREGTPCGGSRGEALFLVVMRIGEREARALVRLRHSVSFRLSRGRRHSRGRRGCPPRPCVFRPVRPCSAP